MVQDVDALDSPTPDEIQETGREIWPKLNSGGTEDMQPNHCKMTDNAVQAAPSTNSLIPQNIHHATAPWSIHCSTMSLYL